MEVSQAPQATQPFLHINGELREDSRGPVGDPGHKSVPRVKHQAPPGFLLLRIVRTEKAQNEMPKDMRRQQLNGICSSQQPVRSSITCPHINFPSSLLAKV